MYDQNGNSQNNWYQQPYQQFQQPYGAPNGYQPFNQQFAGYYGTSEAEKEAVFSAGGSIIMLILAFIGAGSLAYDIISRFAALDFYGILYNLVSYVLKLLIVIGFFLTFAHGRKKVLKSNGISLIRIPYLIQLYFGIFVYIGSLVWWILSSNFVSLAVGSVIFILNCVCFASVNNTLKVARDINQNISTYDRKAGFFAAVIIVVYALLSFAGVLINFFIVGGEANSGTLSKFFEGLFDVKITSVVIAGISFLVSIMAAANLLKFGKKIKEAHGE